MGMEWINPRRQDGVTIPRFWIALAVSVLIHVAAFWRAMPQLHHLTLDEPEQGANSGPIAVRLAPPPSPMTPPPQAESVPRPPAHARPPRPQPKPQPQPSPQSKPNVIALNKPAPASPWPVPAPAPERVQPQPQAAPPVDFASMVEARRRAREAASGSPGMVSSAPAETEAERARRITAANLAPRQQVFGYDPAAGGGIFQIRSLSINNAEVAFYGWNREIRRKTMQIIEVSRGNNPDIKIAVVRKMIAIIREYESDEFVWESKRLGRDMVLSARMRDNAYLEDFMMREFFPDAVVAR